MGTGDVRKEKKIKNLLSSKPVTPDADYRQTRLSCTYKCEAGVRSCCLFISSPYQSQSGLSAPLVFTLPPSSFSPMRSNPFSHAPQGHLLTHLFFVCIPPLGGSLTLYIPVILNGGGGGSAQVPPRLRESCEIVAVVPALTWLLWPVVSGAPTLSNLQQLSHPHGVTVPVCLTHSTYQPTVPNHKNHRHHDDPKPASV